jgi:hypothetical protein
VKRVLATLDTSSSPQMDTGAFQTYLDAHLLAAVDVPSFAQSILEQVPPDYVSPELTSRAAQLSRIRDALGTYRRIAASRGTTAALSLVYQSQFSESEPGNTASPDEKSVSPILTGIDATELMFDSSSNPLWRWSVDAVDIVDTRTADVSYVATPTTAAELGESNPLRFKNPSMRYVKRLEFRRGSDGTWRLAGWPNYIEFEKKLASNVEPSSIVSDRPLEWWKEVPLP